MQIDFQAYAEELALDQHRENMIPVIEKEIIHYEILNALDKDGFLNLLSFQGGTCLRLCYGGLRYSEDLDFAAGDAFDDLDPDLLGSSLSQALERRFDVRVRIKKPRAERDFGGVGVKRWWAVVDTAPVRPDIPSQRIKIEVAAVPSHTRETNRLQLHYAKLPSSYSTILVNCQTLEEILADKLIAFSHAETHVRYRDLWDIPWIWGKLSGMLDKLPELVAFKHADYCCEVPLPIMMKNGAEKALTHLFSDEFRQQMTRFVPLDVLSRTVERPEYLELMGKEIGAAYAAALTSRAA